MNNVEEKLIDMYKKWDCYFMLDSHAEWIDEAIEKDGHEIVFYMREHRDQISKETWDMVWNHVVQKD